MNKGIYLCDRRKSECGECGICRYTKDISHAKNFMRLGKGLYMERPTKDNVPTVNVKLDIGAMMPTRAHPTDAGYDLLSPCEAFIHPGSDVVIDTGVHIAIPEGYVGFLKSKSGLNVKHGITSEGVIDSGYTGSIRVKLYNNGLGAYHIGAGDKITQLVILPILTPDLEQVDDLEDTERGDGGFGSTGR